LTDDPRPPREQGKVPREFLEGVVFANLGAKRSSVLVGPGQGLDNTIISLGGRKVLVVTSDPLSVIPSIGLKESAWLSIHLLASDLSTSGVEPQFAMLDLNLPPKMDLESVGAYVTAISDECRRLGIAIVGGHTGRYPGSDYTVVGGGMMFSVADGEAYVTPAMANPGDAVLITKGAAIGTAAVLGRAFPSTIGSKIGDALLKKAQSRLRDCSTVEDARTAARLGLRRAVTSMHDATEGGVMGGLFELSAACRLSVVVDRERIHVSEEASAVCRLFGLDPLTSLSEGTLIVTCKPEAVGDLQSAFSKQGIPSFHVGKIGEDRQDTGLWVSSGGSKPVQVEPPASDEYWNAYSEAVRKGLK